MISRYSITIFLFAVLFNSIISAQAINNYALRFDGVDDYVRITDTPVLSGGAGKSITIEAWVYPTGAVANGPVIVKWHDANWKDWGLLLSQNRVQISIENEGDNWEFNAGEVLPGQWTHLAFTYNAVTKFVTVYVNGREAGGVYHGKNLPDTEADVTIAKRGYSNEFFAGIIDDIRIWDFAKNTSQVQEQMYIPLAGTESGLSGYWKLDEGVGDTTKDATKGEQNGALISLQNNQVPEWIASTVPFTRLTAINLVAPNGGEILQDSSEIEIKWTADSVISTIKIGLSTDGGFSWTTITNNTPNDGLFLWRGGG